MQTTFNSTSREDLKNFLKKEVKKVSLEELYNLSAKFNEDTKYLPYKYKKLYAESVLKVIINRFTTLKNTKKTYEGNLTAKELEEINQLLNKSDNKLEHTLNIIVIYATYLKKEPVHLPETAFPGRESIYADGEDYYCPVKKYHNNNTNAVCKYCIAKEG